MQISAIKSYSVKALPNIRVFLEVWIDSEFLIGLGFYIKYKLAQSKNKYRVDADHLSLGLFSLRKSRTV